MMAPTEHWSPEVCKTGHRPIKWFFGILSLLTLALIGVCLEALSLSAASRSDAAEIKSQMEVMQRSINADIEIMRHDAQRDSKASDADRDEMKDWLKQMMDRQERIKENQQKMQESITRLLTLYERNGR
jgi:sensor domain CHASE-containing protein